MDISWVLTAGITGLTAFAATNIDDLVVLMVFFAQVNAPSNAPANRKLRPHHIAIGQYLGFTALLLASLLGYLGGLVIPKPWIGLLGLLP